jgi:NADPH-dependent ferric siderophore reductase
MADTTHDEVAARWATGLATGDLAVLAELTSPTMRVWHSHDDTWLSLDEATAAMSAAAGAGAMPALQNVRTHTTPTGFVLQGLVELPGIGRTHIVQVNTVVDAKVDGCEEYIAAEMPPA